MIKLLLITVSRFWLPITVVLLSVITLLSLWPLANLPDVPGTDKTHHLIAYAALAFPAALRKPQHWILYVLLFIIWGGAIELIQPYVNRYGEWLDLLANSTGVALGVLLGFGANRLSNNIKQE